MKQLQRSYMTITTSSYEYMGKYLRISSYIRKPFATLQQLHSEFPYRLGKFDVLFYQCNISSSWNCQTLAAEQPQTGANGTVSQGRWCGPSVTVQIKPARPLSSS
jgi:hypothetical protein